MENPIIGINTSFSGEEIIVPYGYIRAVIDAGGIPFLVPPVEGLNLVREFADKADGFIFIGGKDYHPYHYGGHPQPSEELVHPLRDSFDFALARYILEETFIPILGICGGMQLLALARGGKLIQDIPSAWPTDQLSPLNHVEGMHEVKIITPSLLSRLLGIGEELSIVTNTSHHQAVSPSAPGMDFIPCAFSPDGIVEAIEPHPASHWSREKRFVLGVQWHPERMITDPIQRQLFLRFIEAARRRCQKTT